MMRFCLIFIFLFQNQMLFARSKDHFDPKKLSLQWQLNKNQSAADSGFVCTMSLTNHSGVSLSDTSWKIYFNLRYHGYHLQSLSEAFSIQHVSGELFFIEPATGFSGLPAGQTVKLSYAGRRPIANFHDVPTGFFWVWDNRPGQAIVIPRVNITEPAIPGAQEASVYARLKADEFESVQDIPIENVQKIFPTPHSLQDESGHFLLNHHTRIQADSQFRKEIIYFTGVCDRLLTRDQPVKSQLRNSIYVRYWPMKPEAYLLSIKPDSILIYAGSGAGAFYGMQSLKSLLPANVWAIKQQGIKIPCMQVADEPGFPVRELMLDVARNFQSKDQVFRILELMSFYKMNTFHFHLTDDEGWRLQIPGIPELTEVGARRGYPFADGAQLHPSYGSGPDPANKQGSGYYTSADFKEILTYATERHILVIPEIESPGHARAAVLSMKWRYKKYLELGNPEQAEKFLLTAPGDTSAYLSNQGFRDNVIDAALPSSYRFMMKVIDEIGKMYKDAGAPLTYFHVGGDEVPHGSWSGSPAIQERAGSDSGFSGTAAIWRTYFQRLDSLLSSKGTSMTGWEELATGTQRVDQNRNIELGKDMIHSKTRLEAWLSIYENNNLAYPLANRGFPVVLCPYDYLYLDMAYQPAFQEPGDAWVGYINLKKIFSFNPFDFYKSTTHDMRGNPISPGTYDKSEKLTAQGRSNIRGLQTGLWGENLNKPEYVEYLLLPRLLAVAERSWNSEPAWTAEADSVRSQILFRQDWALFVNRLRKKELLILDHYQGGYLYRKEKRGE